jgi:hypothetical protein
MERPSPASGMVLLWGTASQTLHFTRYRGPVTG